MTTAERTLLLTLGAVTATGDFYVVPVFSSGTATHEQPSRFGLSCAEWRYGADSKEPRGEVEMLKIEYVRDAPDYRKENERPGCGRDRRARCAREDPWTFESALWNHERREGLAEQYQSG